ncbi:hypothetical protein C8Q76DRAFT_599067, partial [Earliella scabrosa]
ERKLRVGQMNDALHGVRVGVAYKSFLFRNNVRPATSQRQKLRSFDEVHLADVGVQTHARVYSRAREALLKLYDMSNPEDRTLLDIQLSVYKPLLKADLKANTTLIEENTRGVHQLNLPWFWSLDVKGDSEGSAWMAEMYRVVWLRALARMKRWEEEIILVPLEMDRTCEWFLHLRQAWRHRRELDRGPGYNAYAHRRMALWQGMHDHAKEVFETV